jgi:hypothetical protein
MTDFVKKTTATAKLDCASTNQEWCNELAEKLGIKEVEGYSIYITRWGQTISLNNTGGAREGKGTVRVFSAEIYTRGCPWIPCMFA